MITTSLAIQSRPASLVTDRADAPTARPARVFPARGVATTWPQTEQSQDAVLELLTRAPFRADKPATRQCRRRGVIKLLEWLADQPGASWQQRWLASGAEDCPGGAWRAGPIGRLQERGQTRSHDRVDLAAGLLMLLCAEVVRPGLPWMLTRSSPHFRVAMTQIRDPAGFATLRALCDGDLAVRGPEADLAISRIATILACKGGAIADITVGDCVELLDAQAEVHAARGGGRVVFYQLLHRAGMFPADAPSSVRVLVGAHGQRRVEELVDRYGLICRPIRDLLVAYLQERQPALDYSSFRQLAATLAGLFWQDLELHHPGIDSLRLTPEAAAGWKRRIATKTTRTTTAAGKLSEVARPRANAKDCMLTVRSFYLDLAHWAAEDPGRWGPWVAPCPISKAEVSRVKQTRHRKAAMDQRTREQLAVLPALLRTAEHRLTDAAATLTLARQTPPGNVFVVAGQQLLRPLLSHSEGTVTWAQNPQSGKRINLTHAESESFWAWAAIEVLRHTGVRLEELLELTHHSLIQYRLPSTGELVPLLQIAPSKTDQERLLLVSPELAEVLSGIICRVRADDGAVPSIPSYDYHERLWLPPMPLLFQRRIGTEARPFTATTIRKLLANTSNAAAVIGSYGSPLTFRPHDIRRIFVTDAILNGLPPHIAQIICGHRDINTTMGYKAIYPEEAINAHRSFIARRRTRRPSEEYRTPTDEEWEEFLGHFERRKVAIGTCGRAFGTPCIHEHSCFSELNFIEHWLMFLVQRWKQTTAYRARWRWLSGGWCLRFERVCL